MTTKATKVPPTRELGDEGEHVHYTPEEVYENRWTPFKPRTLRTKAYKREIPHSRAAGKVTFLPRHIREIQAMHEVRPIAETKPARAAA